MNDQKSEALWVIAVLDDRQSITVNLANLEGMSIIQDLENPGTFQLSAVCNGVQCELSYGDYNKCYRVYNAITNRLGIDVINVNNL